MENKMINSDVLRELGFELFDNINDLAKGTTPCQKWVRIKENENTLVVYFWPEINDCTLGTNGSRLTCAGIHTKSDLVLAANFHGVKLL